MSARIRTTNQARQIRRGITLARRGTRNPFKRAIHPRHVQDVDMRAFTTLEDHTYAVTSSKLWATRRPPPGPSGISRPAGIKPAGDGLTHAERELLTTRLQAALAERDAALSAIERVLNLTGDIGPEARRILKQLPTDALNDHDLALIATHTEMIMNTTRAAAVQAIADAEMRGYQRQMGERISGALAAQNRHYTASPMNEGVGE